MKVGIITFHFVSNQGAVLQCYATKKYLESEEHEVSVIDYSPVYHAIKYAGWKNPFVYTHLFWNKFRKMSLPDRVYLTLRSFARCIYLNISGVDKKKNTQFDAFVKKNLNLTQKYTTLNQLQNDPPDMQAYISGSDQVWNPEILDQSFDRAYFLDFGGKDVSRIAYAVSMGREQDSATLSLLNDLCSGLTAISLREYSNSAIKAIDRDVQICIDPTLLLDADDYSSVESKLVEKDPYIFVYGFETNDSINSAVELAVKKYGCRVINGSPNKIKLREKAENLNAYGPDRFLTLIKNAQCVVTNSFHGTAFSIIYKKDFITVPHSTRGLRMTELLEKLGLNYRLWGNTTFMLDDEINYSEVYEKLDAHRIKSKEFLRNALNS